MDAETHKPRKIGNSLEQVRRQDTAIDKRPHPSKVSITIHLVMSRSTSNMGTDTNRDTNPGAQLWTTMDGLEDIRLEIPS